MSEFKLSGDVVIGLEIHIGLNTKSKLFCSCKNAEGEPNTNVCQLCLGHPGAKPVVNKEAINYALKLCNAAKSKIAPEVVFSRKSYFYPDLSKNFQTTQYELPIGDGGSIELPNGKVVNLIRLHIEEDPAALVHVGGVSDSSYSYIDYNRSGTPLVELVTMPDMSSPEEAREFLKTLISILSYLEIFDVKDGLIKADANVSIRESGYTRAEIKNINGFKEIERALTYEIERQREAAKNGEEFCIETRGWDSENGTTYSMRKKESEADYGYIIDTDLCPIIVTDDWKQEIESSMPQLPLDFAKSVAEEYGVNQSDAYIIANQKAFGSAYKRALGIDPVLATNWFRHTIPTPFVAKYGDLMNVESINEDEIIELFELFKNKKINDKVAKQILEKLVTENFSPKEYIEENDLEMVSDASAFEGFCKEAIAENPAAVEDYKDGEAKALNSLVGQVMKKSKGKANPGEVKNMLIEMLN